MSAAPVPAPSPARITPVLLCGGAGTRLWPLSRRRHPKQFARVLGERTLFQAAAMRLTGDDPAFAPPLVVTHADFRFTAAEQLTGAGIDPGAVLIEPEGRNTGPAILAAALHALRTDPDAVLLVSPSDHVIADGPAFHAAIRAGLAAVEEGRIVAFGITPTRAETGYGWLRLDGPPRQGAARPLAGFVEKPDADRARAYLEDGHHLWNAGLYLFAARDLVAACEAHAPDLMAPVRAAVAGARADLGFLRLDPAPWEAVPSISIDYAVMERLAAAGPTGAPGLSVVPFSGGWSDLGAWDAVMGESPRDADGNALSGPVLAVDCADSLLRAETPGQDLVALGVRGLAVIAMGDAVLVADLARAQDVGRALAELKARGAETAERFALDRRPWGSSEEIARGPRTRVNRLEVRPGAAISLQSHMHRSEHWIVVEGTAEVTLGDETRLLGENQSVYVPMGTPHRIANPGRMGVVLIEVQTGPYLGDDDIRRFEDLYAQGEGQPD